MITDNQTNFVYFSEKLREDFPTETSRITAILDENNVRYEFLKGTNDIWCRDYMPIQVNEDKMAQFTFEPYYLNDSEENKKLKSDPKIVCAQNSLHPSFNGINLDGGNVVKSKGKAILTDIIYTANPGYERPELLSELEQQLEAEIIIIPKHKDDPFGHSDGMVRFLDENSILCNDLSLEYKYFLKDFKTAIKDHNLEIIEIPMEIVIPDKKDSAVGIYINFLHVGKLIIIPEFGLESDDKAYKTISESYPDCTVERVNITRIAEKGGVLNCITWNIII
jgi:agmatine deiminase